MFVFLTMLTLYPDSRQTGFAETTKTSGAAKVYWRRLNSKRSLPVLKWAYESEYFERFKYSGRYINNYFILYLVFSTVVFCYPRACNICPYFTSGYFFVHCACTEIDWEGTGAWKKFTARTGA